MWLSPRPRFEELHKIYATYYTHTAESRSGFARFAEFDARLRRLVAASSFGYDTGQQSIPRRLLGRLLSVVPPLRERVWVTMMCLPGHHRGRLLDVGCGNGSFLAFMKGLGWDVQGVEPDPEAAEMARSRLQAKVLTGTLENAQLPSDYFDAVTLAHVVEHVHDPVTLLKECRRVLKPGGMVVVRTPNLASLGYQLFSEFWLGLEPPRHLSLFNSHTLRVCAEKAGLRTLASRSTAQFAFLLWEGSKLASRGRSWAESKISWPLIFAGLVFQVVEYSATLLGREVGEEAILIGTK